MRGYGILFGELSTYKQKYVYTTQIYMSWMTRAGKVGVRIACGYSRASYLVLDALQLLGDDGDGGVHLLAGARRTRRLVRAPRTPRGLARLVAPRPDAVLCGERVVMAKRYRG